MIEPRIVEKPALHVVGLEAPFIHALSPVANNLKVIGGLWDRFLHESRKVRNRVGSEMYGIVYGRPAAERKHRDELQYVASVAVRSIGEIPDGMVARTTPAGTFAVFVHRGPIANIAKTAQEIYRVWLPQSEYKHAGTADVEMYDHRFCIDSEDSEMEWWIPVTPRST